MFGEEINGNNRHINSYNIIEYYIYIYIYIIYITVGYSWNIHSLFYHVYWSEMMVFEKFTRGSAKGSEG